MSAASVSSNLAEAVSASSSISKVLSIANAGPSLATFFPVKWSVMNKVDCALRVHASLKHPAHAGLLPPGRFAGVGHTG